MPTTSPNRAALLIGSVLLISDLKDTTTARRPSTLMNMDFDGSRGEFGTKVKLFIQYAKILWEMEAVMTVELPPIAKIESILRRFGCLYISYQLSSVAWWHNVVVYGVNTSKNEEPTYQLMNPVHSTLEPQPKSFFYRGNVPWMMVGWHKARSVRHG